MQPYALQGHSSNSTYHQRKSTVDPSQHRQACLDRHNGYSYMHHRPNLRGSSLGVTYSSGRSTNSFNSRDRLILQQ